MYRRRFGPDVAPDGVTIKQLRGLEGHRMKELYRRLSDQHGLSFKRAYKPDDFYSSDPINQALSSANAALYGVVTAAVVALGCHPGLGFIHAGNVSSFVFDIADLYKAEVSVPAAFAASGHSNPGRAALRLTRSAIVEQRLLSRAVTDIQTLLEPGLHSASPSESLLRNDEGFATGGTLYGIDGSPSDPRWQT